MATKTISRTEIMRVAIRAYPDGEMLVGEIDDMSDEELYGRACDDNVGDSLLKFVIIELYEGLDGDLSLERALQLITNGIADLQSVDSAIERMEE